MSEIQRATDLRNSLPSRFNTRTIDTLLRRVGTLVDGMEDDPERADRLARRLLSEWEELGRALRALLKEFASVRLRIRNIAEALEGDEEERRQAARDDVLGWAEDAEDDLDNLYGDLIQLERGAFRAGERAIVQFLRDGGGLLADRVADLSGDLTEVTHELTLFVEDVDRAF